MTKPQIFDKDGNPIDDTILPDGSVLRVPMIMDGTRSLAANLNLTDGQKVAFADAMNAGQSAEDALVTVLTSRPAAPSLAMHRPGFATITDADRAAREKAVTDRSARLSERWRTPAAVDAAQVQKTAPTTPASDADARYAARRSALEKSWRA